MADPHLVPSLPDLFRFVCIILVAALTTGVGWIAGARRLETAFFAGWGLACAVFVIAGTWFAADLGWVAALIGILGIAGLIHRISVRASARDGDGIGFRVLALGVSFLILVLGMSDTAWDDFAFWVPNLQYLATTHHFPTAQQPAVYSVMAGYPYGLALPGFAVHLLTGGPIDTVALEWNLLATLAAGAAFANLLARRLANQHQLPSTMTLWAIAALGVVLEGVACPTFVPKLTLSNMGDSSTAAVLAMLCVLLFDWLAADPKAPERWRILLETSLVGSAFVFIRQANPALLGILAISAGAGIAAFSPRARLGSDSKLVAALVLPLLVMFSWTSYAAREIPHGSHYLLPLHAWHWSVFGDTLASAGHVLIAKLGYTVLSLAIGALCIRTILRRWRAGRDRSSPSNETARNVMLTIVAGLTFGNIAFLLFCYLATSFDIGEAKQAITFWRFIGQTGQAEMLILACILPVRWIVAGMRPGMVRVALPAIAFIWPIAGYSMYRDDLVSPAPRLRAMAAELHRELPSDNQPLTLLDLSGNGYAGLVIKYQLQVMEGDGRPIVPVADPHGIPMDRARTLLPALSGHIWLAEGSHDFPAPLGELTKPGCSYLLAGEIGTFRIVRSWLIGKNRWSTGIYDERVAPDTRCP